MISVCITVKNRSKVQVDGRELLIFPNCIRSIAASMRPGEELEIVVSDWQSDDWPLEEWIKEVAKPVPVSVIPVVGPLCRGKGRNIAADKSRGEILLFLDADMLLCREVIEAGLRCVADGKALFPVCYSYADAGHTRGYWRPAGKGNAMMAREVFLKAGRWPEKKGWGAEDDWFCDAVGKIVPIVRPYIDRFRHQWHPDTVAWKDRYAT